MRTVFIFLCRRLYPDFSFFQLATPYPRMKYNASEDIGVCVLYCTLLEAYDMYLSYMQ